MTQRETTAAYIARLERENRLLAELKAELRWLEATLQLMCEYQTWDEARIMVKAALEELEERRRKYAIM